VDIGAIAEGLSKFLAPLLPYLVRSAETAAGKLGEKLSDAGWEKAKEIWRRLRARVEVSPTANEAVQDILAAPDDPDARTGLRVGLKKILSGDRDLAEELAVLLEAAAPKVSYDAHARDEGVIAQERGVAAREVAVGQDVHGNVIVIRVDAGRMDPERLLEAVTRRPPDFDLECATARYLDFLFDRYRYLDFRGMGVSDRVPLQLPLLELYIPLQARVGTPEGETWARELKLAGRRVTEEEAEAMGRRVSAPQPVLNLLAGHDGLIVLGDPGAGKTTFLKFLALSLATGQGEALALGIRLPVLVPLSAYANALKPGEADIPLHRFIAEYYRGRGVELSIQALLGQALERGTTLLLLDGLDEVRDPGQRRRVVDLVTDFFTVHRKGGNKFVLTSRIVGYPEVRPRVEALAECTLADLEDEEIGQFVDKWTESLERAALGQGRAAAFEAERERDELLFAIRRNPGVRALAVNPLLLTVLALMKRQGITLPERRVELYEKYVETLLKHWNLARSLAGRVGRDLDEVETVRILAPLALWMHRTSPGVGLGRKRPCSASSRTSTALASTPIPGAPPASSSTTCASTRACCSIAARASSASST
jgi:hypothetical protein